MITNMITHAPAAFDGRAGLLYTAGFDPERFLPVPTLGPRFRAAGIETHGFRGFGPPGSRRMAFSTTASAARGFPACITPT